ncbi:MAG: hypothetical protein WAM84_01060, partial [Candidatus Cybelea sp.]
RDARRSLGTQDWFLADAAFTQAFLQQQQPKAACTIAKNRSPYVIVTNKYSKSTCTTGIISSATVAESERISNFIQEQRLIPPFTIKVLNSPSP